MKWSDKYDNNMDKSGRVENKKMDPEGAQPTDDVKMDAENAKTVRETANSNQSTAWRGEKNPGEQHQGSSGCSLSNTSLHYKNSTSLQLQALHRRVDHSKEWM